MVLIGRAAVLGLVLGVVVLGGCSESLFGARGAGGGGGDDGGTDNVPGTCTAPCVADAAADFDGTPGGKTGHWRYLEDHRDRTWTAMTGDATGMAGKDPANQITTCAAHPEAAACKALPGALLVSSAGGASGADPAIELTAPANQVIQLSLHAYVPSGADQTIRLYRNSREDVLFTGTATAGQPLEKAITLDALSGDRFLVAVTPATPMGSGATRVGLDLFAAGTTMAFPSDCQLAVPFDSASGSTTGDRCRNAVFTHYVYMPTPPPGRGTETPAVLGPGPFPDPNRGLVIVPTEYIEAAPANLLDWSHDLTLQLWMLLPQKPTTATWLFSDLDPDIGGGVEITVVPNIPNPSDISLTVSACTDPNPQGVKFDSRNITYPTDGSWQFVRVIRAGASVTVCLNGQRVTSFPVDPNLPPTFGTGYPPVLGKNDLPSSQDPTFNGQIDDLRAITGALPCDPPP